MTLEELSDPPTSEQRLESARKSLAQKNAEIERLKKLKLTCVCPECGGSGQFDEIPDDLRCDRCGGLGYLDPAAKEESIMSLPEEIDR